MPLEGRVKTKASLDNVALDADGHPQVDVLTMPPVTVEVAEKGFSNAADTPTRALVDADRHVQTDVLNLPTDYAKEAKQILLDADKHGQVDVLAVANPPNLDVALSTRASEATLASELTRKVKGDQGLIKQVSATDYRLSVLSEVSNQILRDADGHGQVDVLTMPPVTVEVAEKGFSNAADTPTRALVDADRHVQTDVLNLPGDYAKEAKQILLDADGHGQVDVLTVANPSNLDVALSTRASDASLTRTDVESAAGVFSKRVDIRYDNVGLAKSADVSATQPRNVAQWGGAALTGRDVSGDLAKLQNLDVLLSSRATNEARDADGHPQVDVLTFPANQPVVVSDITKVSSRKYLPPTSLAAGGTATVWTPATGKAVRLKFFSVTTNTATLIILREGTTDWIAFYLPANGLVVVNLVGANVQFAANASLIVYSSAAATVSATAIGDEV